MSALLARLREALAPTYVIEREIEHGGMGVVFRARDTTLERAVAIKVIRPELATASLVERFLREARLLANLNHPRIVPVYTAGEADGLFYFVMPFIEGETLAQRLQRGPLPGREAVRVTLDVLAALEVAHSNGIVHRDVTARNVFLVDGRALLADFGTATTDSEPARPVAGTLGAMPPEQARGEAVSPATDVYATGLLLYHALTGRAWPMTPQPAAEAWTGVPRSIARVLRRALRWQPADRFADAGAFAEAIERTTRRRRVILAIALLLTVTGTLSAVILRTRTAAAPAGAESDVAVHPFEHDGARDTVGRDLARLVTLGLDGVPELHVAPAHHVFRWADAQAADAAPAYHELHARQHIRGAIVQRGRALDVRVQVVEPNGRVLAAVAATGILDSLPALADTIAIQVLRRVHPRLAASFGGFSPATTGNLSALREFLLGERAFEQGAWLPADRHFRAAVAHDSTFALAWWRLLNTWRWLPTVLPDPQLDMAGLYRAHGSRLPEIDRLLVDAHITRAVDERLRKLEEATRRHPRDGYAALMHGVELWHRGPLVGIPQARALPVLEHAAMLNEFLAPAHENVAWAAIRIGDRARARAALDRLATVVAPRAAVDVYTPDFFEQAYSARFEAPQWQHRQRVFFDPDHAAGLNALRFGARAGLMVGLPRTQRTVARLLADAGRATAADRASAYEALGLAELSQGDVKAGLAHIDSAALLAGSPAAKLEAAAWRALGPALGWPRITREEQRAALASLRAYATQPDKAVRAAWLLAVVALLQDGDAEAQRAVTEFRSRHGAASAHLLQLLDAIAAARAGDYRRALLGSAPLTRSDARATSVEPFARAVLFLQRAAWQAALGDLESAESELVWAENLDVIGWPKGPAQTAEVDWAYAVYALQRRAELARRRGDVAAACARLREARLQMQGEALPLAADTRGCTT